MGDLTVAAIRSRYTLGFTPDFAEWPKKTIGKAMESANSAIGNLWFGRMLKKHFEHSAIREYGYAKRDRGYVIDKAKREGHTKPLQGISRRGKRSGQLKRAALRSGLIRAGRKNLKVQFEVPKHATLRSAGGSGPDLVSELTAVSEAEAQEFAKLAGRVMADELENEPKRKRIRT